MGELFPGDAAVAVEVEVREDAYAQQAGVRDVEILPIDNDFWRFYRLVG